MCAPIRKPQHLVADFKTLFSVIGSGDITPLTIISQQNVLSEGKGQRYQKDTSSVVGSRNLVLIFFFNTSPSSLALTKGQRTLRSLFTVVIWPSPTCVIIPRFRGILYSATQLIQERLYYSPNIIFSKNPRLGKILPGLSLTDVFFNKRELGLMNFPRTNLCLRRICWKPVVELKPKNERDVANHGGMPVEISEDNHLLNFKSLFRCLIPLDPRRHKILDFCTDASFRCTSPTSDQDNHRPTVLLVDQVLWIILHHLICKAKDRLPANHL